MIPRLLQELVLLKGGFPPEIVEIRNFSVHSAAEKKKQRLETTVA
jgi:hypothetical protein